ncbi:MAG TPA: calcium/sodium antiporter [Deltaproteobacteria bacterium]|nr:calcium/sodium antiporter [Deltaproteobacteria bacterium]
MWLAFLALAGGLSLLFFGGEMLVAGASRLARRLGMSPLLVGLTVVAFGTSMPEMFVSLAATFQNHADIMIGNVVGSNIANVGLVLGVSALLMPLPVRHSQVYTELYLLLAASLGVAAISWFGVFYRPFGLIFVGALIIYTVQAYRGEAKKNRENGNSPDNSGPSMFKITGQLVVGLAFLAVGSDFFIDGAVDVALHFGVSELVIGLTLAAVGTSLPELASSIAAVRHGEPQILVGNVVGSNLFNLLMVMGVTAVIKPFSFAPEMMVRDLPAMIMFSALLWPIVYYRHGVNRSHGLVMIAGYVCYLLLLV